MRQINFAEGKWDSKEFRHVYSSRFSSTPLMCQEKECIVNDIDMETGTFAYVSLVTDSRYKTCFWKNPSRYHNRAVKSIGHSCNS